MRAPTAATLLVWAIVHLRPRLAWRALLILLGVRRTTPRPGELLPDQLAVVAPAADTGGGYRPKHRPQNPASDPDEPGDGEGSSRGEEHGWANCTMSSGADALAYESDGHRTPWGGTLRHSGQPDLDGGTDLYDLRDAWRELGYELLIWSGRGWGDVKAAHADGRPIVIQGVGNVPGSGTFTGGHACCIGAETHSDGRWLWGDPCVSDWQWIEPGAIRSWAEAWQSSIAFAVGHPPVEPPPPVPPPTPLPPDLTPYDQGDIDAAVQYAVVAAEDETVGAWLDYLRAGPDGPADRWQLGCWTSDVDLLLADGDPCAELMPARWSRGRLPYPVQDALRAWRLPPLWDETSWRAGAWHG